MTTASTSATHTHDKPGARRIGSTRTGASPYGLEIDEQSAARPATEWLPSAHGRVLVPPRRATTLGDDRPPADAADQAHERADEDSGERSQGQEGRPTSERAEGPGHPQRTAIEGAAHDDDAAHLSAGSTTVAGPTPGRRPPDPDTFRTSGSRSSPTVRVRPRSWRSVTVGALHHHSPSGYRRSTARRTRPRLTPAAHPAPARRQPSAVLDKCEPSPSTSTRHDQPRHDQAQDRDAQVSEAPREGGDAVTGDPPTTPRPPTATTVCPA